MQSQKDDDDGDVNTIINTDNNSNATNLEY